MGIDLISAAIVLPTGTVPSWELAERWIENLPLAVLTETGDELFPLEAWAEEAPESGSWEASVMTAARRDLRERASRVRAATERPSDAGVLEVSLPTHRIFLASDVDGGDGVIQLVDDFIFFAEGGVAAATGFSHWTQFAPRPLAERLPPAMCDLAAWKPAHELAAACNVQPCQDPAEWIAWLAAANLDWAAARSGLQRGGASELVEELDFLRAVLEDDSIRMVSSIEIDDLTLWTVADNGPFGGRAVQSVHRLAEAGALRTAGFIRWSTPVRARSHDECPR